MVDNLTPKQKHFVDAYIKTNGNQTKAAQTAGMGNGDNYSSVAGHRMIRNDKVSDAIQEQSEAIGLSTERILKRLSRIILNGKDNDSIQAIKVWADLTGSNAPTRMKFMNDLNNIPKTPEEIDDMLEKMRRTA